jgi:hypothetical protein
MMETFLQICQAVRRETGISGAGPVNTGVLSGIEGKLIGYVRDAWVDVQTYRNDWPWMRKTLQVVTSPGKQRHTITELNLTDFERWDFLGASIYKQDDGVAGEQPLGSTTFDMWWSTGRLGLQQQQAPWVLFFDPEDNALMFHPIPDAEYLITLRYFRAPQILSADGDIPRLPVNQAWRDIIKWRALWYYGYHDGAPDVLAEAEMKWDEMIHALDNAYGQIITIAGRPIA